MAKVLTKRTRKEADLNSVERYYTCGQNATARCKPQCYVNGNYSEAGYSYGFQYYYPSEYEH